MWTNTLAQDLPLSGRRCEIKVICVCVGCQFDKYNFTFEKIHFQIGQIHWPNRPGMLDGEMLDKGDVCECWLPV